MCGSGSREGGGGELGGREGGDQDGVTGWVGGGGGERGCGRGRGGRGWLGRGSILFTVIPYNSLDKAILNVVWFW